MHFSGILNNFNTLGLLDGVHMHMDPVAFMSDYSVRKTLTWTRCMPILDKKITKTTSLLFFFFTKTTSGAYTGDRLMIQFRDNDSDTTYLDNVDTCNKVNKYKTPGDLYENLLYRTEVRFKTSRQRHFGGQSLACL